MYLHLGQDIAVKTSDIIGIFNMETTTTLPQTREFLANAQKENQVVNVNENLLPSAFVVCERKNIEKKVYITPISSVTLKKRTMF